MPAAAGKSCSKLYKSKAITKMREKEWDKYMNIALREQGGLEPNAYANFNKGFRRGFMRQCKTARRTGGRRSRRQQRHRRTYKKSI